MKKKIKNCKKLRGFMKVVEEVQVTALQILNLKNPTIVDCAGEGSRKKMD